MKKLMFAAVAALVMVGAAQAAATYEYLSEFIVGYYGDKDPHGANDLNAGWYSCYGLTQKAAQKAMGTTETVTYQAYADWLGKNFAENKATTIDCAQGPIPFYASKYTWYQYVVDGPLGEPSDVAGAIGVVFFEHDSEEAYKVIPGAVGDQWLRLEFDERNCATSGWIAVGAVPEPTSGLLLLLGLAGLALKRKQRG